MPASCTCRYHIESAADSGPKVHARHLERHTRRGRQARKAARRPSLSGPLNLNSFLNEGTRGWGYSSSLQKHDRLQRCELNLVSPAPFLRSSAIRTNLAIHVQPIGFQGRRFCCLTNLSPGRNLPLFNDLISGNHENVVVKIHARANVIGNNPEPVAYLSSLESSGTTK